MADSNVTSRQLSVYLDGELDGAEARQVADALEGSEALRQELAELRAVRELLMGLPRHRGGDELAGRILAAAEQLQGRQPVGTAGRLTLWVRRLSVAAVLLVAASGGVMMTVSWLSRPAPDPPGGTPIAHHDAAKDDRAKDLSPRPGPGKGGKRREVSDVVDAKVDAGSEIIFTHDLDEAQVAVERVMLTNGLRPEPKATSARHGKMVDKEMRRSGGGGNFRFRRLGAETITYEVEGTPEQVMNLRAGIVRIRKSQFVEQRAGWKTKAAATPAAAKPLAKAPGAAPRPIVGKGGLAAGAAPMAPVQRGKQGGGAGGGGTVEEKMEDAPEPSVAAGVQQIVQAAELLFKRTVAGQSTARGGRADSVQQAEGLTRPGEDQKQQRKVARGGVANGALQESETPGRQVRTPVDLADLQDRRANRQRLVITLNKSPLTAEAAARRDAAMQRAAENAKQ